MPAWWMCCSYDNLKMLPVPFTKCARSSSGGVAICHVLPVLWVTLYLHIMSCIEDIDTGAASEVTASSCTGLRRSSGVSQSVATWMISVIDFQSLPPSLTRSRFHFRYTCCTDPSHIRFFPSLKTSKTLKRTASTEQFGFVLVIFHWKPT